MRESERLSGWFYLSFACDVTGNFLGAAIVEADEIEAAATRAWELEINPGDDVLGCRLKAAIVPKQCFRNRLLTKEETRLAFPSGMYGHRERRAIYDVN